MVKNEVAVKEKEEKGKEGTVVNTVTRLTRAERQKHIEELGRTIKLTGEDLADALLVGGIFVINAIEDELKIDPTLLEGLMVAAAKKVRKLHARAKQHTKPEAKHRTNQRAHHITLAILLIDI